MHFEADEILAKKGVISIYFSSSDLKDNDTFGYLNLSSRYTVFQKKALFAFRKYLPYYEDFLINQYDEETRRLVELNSLTDQNYVKIFDQILGISLENTDSYSSGVRFH